MNGVLVTHPGRQHSHQLATALHERGLLDGYWTGVPVRRWPSRLVPRVLWNRVMKYDAVDLPAMLVRQWPVAPALRHTIGRVGSAPWATRVAHIADGLFDRLAAHTLSRLTGDAPRVVVCYENAARDTFRAAKYVGAKTVLDASSIHHTLQDKLCAHTESTETHERIVRRKNQEIELADHIITVSEAARQSYLVAGVRPEKVVAIPLGVELEVFRYQERSERDTSSAFHFVYAGNGSTVKGTDILLVAMENLQKSGLAARLTIAGGCSPGLSAPSQAGVEWAGRLPQRALASLFGSADCFILPSRFDAFGMVVIEALACGLPAIVSDRVGAGEAVQEGGCGWVVPAGDVYALTSQMRQCVEHRSTVKALRPRARATSERYTWLRYRQAVADHLAAIAG